MPGTFQITLDTTGPGGLSLVLDTGNPQWSTDFVVDALIGTTDPDTTGYQVKLWGDIVGVPNEAAAVWQNYAPSIPVTLTPGDGAKTVNVRMRDDVWNATAGTATDSILVDSTAPIITILAGPDRTKISKVAGRDVTVISWVVDSSIQAYKVKVVPSSGSLHNAGAQIPSAGGSVNVSMVPPGAVEVGVQVTTEIHGVDLESADPGDNTKWVKIFVQDFAGNWSVL